MILYKLRDPDRAPALAQHFEQLFQHEAHSWQDREEANLQLFLTLRISAAITVSLIILLAGFGIFNVLTMTVLSKIKEIAILRSMGYRRRDISAIFLWQGALIAALGSLIGCLIGGAFGHRGFAHSAACPRLALRGLFSGRFRLAPLFVGHSSRHHRGFDRQLGAGAPRGSASAGRDPPRIERMTNEVCLRCDGIERYLGEEEARVHALRGVSLTLEAGTVHAVVGPSGCGKSTLLYILGLLDHPDRGEVTIESEAGLRSAR